MTAPLVSTTDRPYQLLPPLTVEQRDLLRQSIKENGVLEPVVFDEDGEILDGHHRVEIAEELGIEYPRRVITDLDRPGKHMYALTVNVARRQLDQSARSTLVAQMRIRGMSIRRIAETLGVSYGTVRNDLAQVSKTAHLPEEITGADGKSYAATRPTPDVHPSWPTEAELKPWETLAPEADRLAESMEPIADDPRDRTHGAEFEAYDAAESHTQTPEPVTAPTVPVAGSGSTSPEPGRHLRSVSEPTTEAAKGLRSDLALESERRAAAAGLRSVLTYLTSRVLEPAQLAQDYVIALDEFDPEQLRFAAETMAAIAALKER